MSVVRHKIVFECHPNDVPQNLAPEPHPASRVHNPTGEESEIILSLDVEHLCLQEHLEDTHCQVAYNHDHDYYNLPVHVQQIGTY